MLSSIDTYAFFRITDEKYKKWPLLLILLTKP
jgi:hypothetical protein